MTSQPEGLIRVRETATPEVLRRRLEAYEAQFGLSSAEFLAGWRAGTHPEWDTPDHLAWIGFCFLAVRQGQLTAAAPAEPASSHV